MKTKNLLSGWIVAILFLFAFTNAKANNVIITGTSVSGSNITFNISWDNSWNANIAPANWDAVWVFVKYQDCNTRVWAHAGLSTLAADHTAGTPLQADPVTDGKGVFVRRSALGGGNISNVSVTLKMTLPAGTYNYKVFGIEMVNVPQGTFDLGDGTSTTTLNSISVTSAIETNGVTAAILGGGSASIAGTYPVGFNSFYSMKYEISQEQYADYLNALTYDQQKAHTISDPISAIGTLAFPSSGRNGVIISTPGNNSAIPAIYACDATTGIEGNINDGQAVAMNGLSWADLSAFLDWSALRPMSELEFEKICRGVSPRVAGEFPWGTLEVNYVTPSNVLNSLKPNETYNTAVNGLCNFSGGNSGYPYYSILGYQNPLKVGFSATGSSGRASAGAAYYGAMEMAGNVSEQVVSVSIDGAGFTGNNGDGTLLANGNSNQVSWPSITTALGVGLRGGSFGDGSTSARTSDRSSITTAPTSRANNYGGRGVR